MTRLGARVDDVEDMVLERRVVVEMMHGVGVVPEDSEVAGSRLECGQPTYDFVRVRVAAGVRVLGDAPDTLDRWVCYEARNFGNVRAVLAQLDGNHLDAKVLADGEMTIISRARANELDVIELAPGRLAAQSRYPGPRNGVEHDVEARASAYHDLLRRDVEHVSDECAGLGQAGEHAVVTAVRAIVCEVVGL